MRNVNTSELDGILREPQVLALANVCHSTLWRMERAGRFPKRVKITDRSVGWRRREVERWLEELR
jgi:prophage regulatory protein